MSVKQASAWRFTCDNPSCGRFELTETGRKVPGGWLEVWLRGGGEPDGEGPILYFHEEACLVQWARRVRVEEVDQSGSGRMLTSIPHVLHRDPRDAEWVAQEEEVVPE